MSSAHRGTIFDSREADGVRNLVATWQTDVAGKLEGYEASWLLTDINDSCHYAFSVQFASLDSLMRYANPETDSVLGELGRLADGPLRTDIQENINYHDVPGRVQRSAPAFRPMFFTARDADAVESAVIHWQTSEAEKFSGYRRSWFVRYPEISRRYAFSAEFASREAMLEQAEESLGPLVRKVASLSEGDLEYGDLTWDHVLYDERH